MVFFLCDGCGESVKKNQVEKHQGTCRRSHSFSCMDCNKVFTNDQWKSHNKCISEAEKYGGKNYVPKENKGEIKQQTWYENVQAAISGVSPKNKRLKEILGKIQAYPNIPRKEPKFLNFVKNSLNIKEFRLAKEAWQAISDAAKRIQEEKAAKKCGEVEGEQNGVGSGDHLEGSQEKKGKNRNKGESSSLQAENIEENKKRRGSEHSGETGEEPKKKKVKKYQDLTEQVEVEVKDGDSDRSELKKKKKKKKLKLSQEEGVASEHSEIKVRDLAPEEQSGEDLVSSGFKWKAVMKKLLKASPGQSMKVKKLKKEVLEEYKKVSGSAVGVQAFEEAFMQKLTEMKKVVVEGKIAKLFTEGSENTFARLSKNLQILFSLEVVTTSLMFFDHNSAEKWIKKAVELSGLEIELAGALGKRTYFQQRSLPQLKVSVTHTGQNGEADCMEGSRSSEHVLPLNCTLKDDTVMDKVKFEEEDSKDLVKLSPLQQAVVLAVTKFQWKIQPKHGDLLQEEIRAYIDKLLQFPQDWAIHGATLFLRCQVEKTERRRVERALCQIEQLCNEFEMDSEEGGSSKNLGSPLVFAAGLSPMWKIKKFYADLLMTLGITSEALGIYEKLECWEQVISCYRRLDKLDYAEHIVRDRLKEKEDPKFLCLLGDITSNPVHYERAWEVSKGRSAQSQRALGRLYIGKKEYVKAFECLKRSLEIQQIQENTWFNLGYCCMKLKRYEEAAMAYHRCVNIEPDNFEAWNNLAASHIHLKKLDKAYHTLKEAIRYNYEDWKVWENFLAVSTETENFRDSIQSYHRLLDLKQKFVDLDILRTLVEKIVTEEKYRHLKSELRKLFGRLTSVVTGDGKVWELYAKLIEPESGADVESWDKYVNFLMKAHQLGFQKNNWEKDEERCLGVLKNLEKLVDAQGVLAGILKGERGMQIKGSVRLTVKSVLTRVKNFYCSIGVINVKDIENVKIREICENLEKFV